MIMREFCLKLFRQSFFDSGIHLTPFSVSHIVYMVLIFGGITLLWLALRHKSQHMQVKTLRILAYLLVFSYLSDFFFHDFVYGSLNLDKLPFHLCTVLCPIIAVAQFRHNGQKVAEPAGILAILCSLMYLCYPASVGTGEPWCYQTVQTMFYHGLLLAWGSLTFAFGLVKPHIRHIWKCGIALVLITLWAKLGNLTYVHYNWFFLEEDALYIGLVANGVIPKWSLMLINPAVFMLASLCLYGVIHGIRNFSQKHTSVAFSPIDTQKATLTFSIMQ